MLSGDLDQAAVLLKRARRQDPDEPEVHEGAARLATRLGDERRAERHLRKAASLRARLQADRP
jgi:Flp pilus assembly protein TadD